MNQAWLLGIAVTVLAIGISLYYQGWVMAKPTDPIKQGKALKNLGIFWVVLALIYALVSFLLPK